MPVQDRQQDGNIPVFGSNGTLDCHNLARAQGGGVITGRSGTIGKVYYEDDIVDMIENESELENDDLKNYKAKAEFYVRQHQDNLVIVKVKSNQPLTELDDRQIYFVNQIVEYIVHNGLLKDMSVLQGAPFTDRGSVVEIFTDLTVWQGIRKIIEQINTRDCNKFCVNRIQDIQPPGLMLE